MFRALRFSARMGFSIEPETLSAIERCADTAGTLAPERVRDELEKILLSPAPETVNIAIRLGLLKRYLPAEGIKTPDLSGIASLQHKPLTRWTAFALILQNCGCIGSAEDLLTKLRLDGRTVRCCSDAGEILGTDLPSDKIGWKKLLNRYGLDSVSCAVSAYEAIYGKSFEKELKTVLKSGECFSVKHLAVTGDDLLELGFKGAQLGEMLRFLLDYVMEYPDKNRREILLSLAYSEEN